MTGLEKCKFYELESSKLKVRLCDFGASIIDIIVKDKDIDVTVGYKDLQGYYNSTAYCGLAVGRNANRIADGKFTLNGKEYKLDLNDNGCNNLHSGNKGYSKRIWNSRVIDKNTVEFNLKSPHMDQGFPGNISVSVTYSLVNENELKIEYSATSDEDTVFNMTNHSYFNLEGFNGSNTIKDHFVEIDADYYTPINENMIPTGEIAPVDNTPMDFRKAKKAGEDIDSDFNQLKLAGGYDHNYVLKEGQGIRKFATVYSEKTGIKLEAFTDLPGVQFYSGNFLDNDKDPDKNGNRLIKRAGLCLETQYFPNAVNCSNFKKPILKKNETVKSTTIYKFS